jgi:hypothetical protein
MQMRRQDEGKKDPKIMKLRLQILYDLLQKYPRIIKYTCHDLYSRMTYGNLSFFAADSSPYGKTYGNWTIAWWRWALAIPKSTNPIVDLTGENAGINQRNEDVSFLAGKMASEDRTLPNRYCTLSTEKSILFPVINCESNQLEHPELRTHQDVIDSVKKDEDTIIKKECYVDDTRVPVQRIKSDPVIFELNMVDDNLFNVRGGKTYASADGYWVFLKPLPIGKHTIFFQGSCEYGRLNSGAIYNLEVL